MHTHLKSPCEAAGRKVHSTLKEKDDMGETTEEPQNELEDCYRCQRRVSHCREEKKLMIQLKTPEPATVSIKDNDFLLVATVTHCWQRGRWLQRLFPPALLQSLLLFLYRFNFFLRASLSLSALL